MALNTNLSTSNTAATASTRGNDLSPSMQTYYNKKLLKDMKPKLVHMQFGQKKPIPANNGKTIKFRKYTPFAARLTALTEGLPGDGQSLTMVDKVASISQYGGFVAISDLLDLTALDPVVNDAVEQMADQGALTLDTLVRDELTAGADATNVIYAAGTTRTGIATTDKLTSVLLRKAVRALKKAKTPMFSGSGGRPHYIAIVGPDTTYDLQDDASWKAVAEYQDKEAIYSGEIGRLYGVRIIETTESKIFAAAGAGTPKADIAATLVIGKDAYGIIDVGGDGAVKTIVHPCGSAGTADPLDQVSTVGWKVPAFTCRILMPERIVRIEHGVSA